jgi:hypothetical protein
LEIKKIANPIGMINHFAASLSCGFKYNNKTSNFPSAKYPNNIENAREIKSVITDSQLNPFPRHPALVIEREIAKRTSTTTSLITVIPKKALVNGPFALHSFAIAIAEEGDLAVIIAPKSIAIPSKQP